MDYFALNIQSRQASPHWQNKIDGRPIEVDLRFLCFLPTFVLRQAIPLRRYSQQGFTLVGVVRFLGITPAFLSTFAIPF